MVDELSALLLLVRHSETISKLHDHEVFVKANIMAMQHELCFDGKPQVPLSALNALIALNACSK